MRNKLTPIVKIIILVMCTACGINSAKGNPIFEVSKVQSVITKNGSHAEGNNLSLFIDFSVTRLLNDWAIGFYMPRTFNRLINSANPINTNMTMEVCAEGSSVKCAPLTYVKKGMIDHNIIYGDGFSNVLTLKKGYKFPLKPTLTYQLAIKNSNQAAPINLNSMPQSFFIVKNFRQPKIQKLINSAAKIKVLGTNFRNISGYNSKKVQQSIANHIEQNWQRSIPVLQTSLAIKYHLVPLPRQIQSLSGPGFDFNRKTITYRSSFKHPQNIELLREYLKKDLAVKLTKGNDPDIIIKRSNGEPEAYHISIENNKITVVAATATGVFYAIQTLRQLWNQSNKIPSMQIDDGPRFKYRGILLDVARHYFTINEIKKLINAMAAMKFNVLHIHFSDDEGWRLAINALPKKIQTLASTRGYVKGSTNPAGLYQQANFDITNYENFDPKTGQLIANNYPKADSKYSGIYSRKQIRELIQFANARQITIIPEIDFPGHARALVQAWPEVFIDPNDKSEYISVQGFYQDVLPVCLYNQSDIQSKKFTKVVNRIIFDINRLFKNQTTLYNIPEVSLGGDEVSPDAWKNDVSCQDNWSSMDALTKSHAFFKQLQKSNPNILLSGWQQFVQNDNGDLGKQSISPQSVGHIWVWAPSNTGIKQAQTLAKVGYPTVLAFSDNLYFDLTFQPGMWQPGFYWAGSFLDTHAADYAAINANKVLDGLPDNAKPKILGLEGDLWSENMVNARHLFYMALPKMTGLAESAWSSRNSITNNSGQIAWQSLADRLGYNNQGFLGYLHKTTGAIYRGYPNGIRLETVF